MLITFYDTYNVLSAVYGKEQYIKQALTNTMVRESSRAHLNKLCYGVLDKDVTLSYILSKLCAKNPKLPIKILLKIGLYSIKYLNTPPHLVTDNIVELAKKLGKGGTAGFINAVLRNYVRNGVEFNESGVKLLSVKYSYPEFIVKELINDYGKETAENIISTDEETAFIRFNLGYNGEDYLKNKGVRYETTPFSNTFKVFNFKMNEDFYEGIYTFQSVGSVAICEMVGSGNTLLDACSAPGGKAVYLADKFSSVIACELHEHRAGLIKSYVSRMQKNNVEVKNVDSTIFNSEYENAFDTVLCDAPCSGTGVLKENPDIKLKRTLDSVLELTKTQGLLLDNLSKYVKVGGSLCYSTCSILKKENDGVIKKFLSNHKNYVVEEITSPLNGYKTDYGITFMPHLSMGAGFYFCKLRRVE